MQNLSDREPSQVPQTRSTYGKWHWVYDGGTWHTLAFASTGSGWGTISTSVSLTAGYNVIRLAMGAPFFAGGSGAVNLGYLQLS